MEGDKEIIKQYSNENITVTWQPGKCTHSTKCWKGLIGVFNPRNKPWISLDKSTDEKIMYQIDVCPSKALSYKIK